MKALPYGRLALLAGSLGWAPIVPAEMNRPTLNRGEFDKKLSRDTSLLPSAARGVGGYADVVQRVLPSVVSIGTYSRTPRQSWDFNFHQDDLNRLPPLLRDFFEDWMGPRPFRGPRDGPRPKSPQSIQTGLGSGVILTADGYILTNNHVVDAGDELKVSLSGKAKQFPAKVIGSDPQTDIALIKIEAEGLTPATLGDSTKLRVGDLVLAVGSPLGLEGSVTHGIVSGLGRSDLGIIGKGAGELPGYENFIQTDAAINPGNSGGPLLDEHGRVIGLNAAIETRSGMFAGIGLAIPATMAIAVARDLLEEGKVERGFLGIEMGLPDASLLEHLQLEPGSAVIVNAVLDSSPAAAAGFQEGDALVAINDQKITSPAQIRLMISALRAGTEVRFEVLRFQEKTQQAEPLTLTARLAALPPQPSSKNPRKFSAPSPSPSGDHFLPGISMANATPALRQEYNLPEDVAGVVVTSVDQDSPVAASLTEGDLIVQVNRHPVGDVADALAHRGPENRPVYLKIHRDGGVKFVIIKR